jgi:molybdate transport system substrate-binding protein
MNRTLRTSALVSVLLFVISASLILSSCGRQNPNASTETRPLPAIGAGSRVITVFAAASLADAFREVELSFERANPGINVRFNFGGSQTLRTQIEQGAQADVFASANQKEMEVLVGDQLIGPGEPRDFIENQMVIAIPANNPAQLTSLADLARPGLKVVLAAPEVPAGAYSLQILDHLEITVSSSYKEQVLANVVSYENDVRQVLTKVQLGEADAGIVYSSDLVAAQGLQNIQIPAESNVAARYSIAGLAQSANPELAQAFIEYILSPEGQNILVKWGFLPVK